MDTSIDRSMDAFLPKKLPVELNSAALDVALSVGEVSRSEVIPQGDSHLFNEESKSVQGDSHPREGPKSFVANFDELRDTLIDCPDGCECDYCHRVHSAIDQLKIRRLAKEWSKSHTNDSIECQYPPFVVLSGSTTSSSLLGRLFFDSDWQQPDIEDERSSVGPNSDPQIPCIDCPELIPIVVASVLQANGDDAITTVTDPDSKVGNALFAHLIINLRCFSCSRLGCVLPIDYSLFSCRQWRSFMLHLRRRKNAHKVAISNFMYKTMVEGILQSVNLDSQRKNIPDYDEIVEDLKKVVHFSGVHRCQSNDSCLGVANAALKNAGTAVGDISMFCYQCCPESFCYVIFDTKVKTYVDACVDDWMLSNVLTSLATDNWTQAWFNIGSHIKYKFVAQGCEVKILHWYDDLLPESRFVIRDSTVRPYLLDFWIAGNWPVMPGYEFASCIPALACTIGNHCDICGGVDMCSHLLREIICDIEIDIGFYMKLAESGVFSLLRLRDNPLNVSLSSPHIRYAIARSLKLYSSDVRLDHWVAAAESLAIELYPHNVVAQTFFGDAYTALTSSLGAVVDFLAYVPGELCRVFGDVIGWVISNVKDFISGGMSFMTDTIVQIVFDKACQAGSFVKEQIIIFKPVIFSLIKTLIRIAVGYTAPSVLLELVWDNAIVTGACSLLKFFTPTVEAQSVTDFGGVVTALCIAIFVGLGRAVPNVRVVSDLMMAMITAVGVYNRAQLWDQFMTLLKYYDGDEKSARIEVLRTMFPASISMMETHIDIVSASSRGESVASQRVQLSADYAKYLKERRNYGHDSREMSELMAPSIRYVTTTGIYAIENIRRRAAFFMFWGPTKLGKSHLVARLSQYIANKHKDRFSPGGIFSYNNASYHVDVGDEYCSGYDSQPIWLFDEWGQEIDSDVKPSKSVSLLFTLVSTQPGKLNMAACDDKGKLAKVDLVIGATNQEMTDANIKTHVKSKVDPEAVCTRIKYRIKPILQKGFVSKNRMIMKYVTLEGKDMPTLVPVDSFVSEEELYEFKITMFGDETLPGDLSNGNHSWKSLINLADMEYCACVNYDPLSMPMNMDLFDSIDDKGKEEEIVPFHAEGWGDITSYFTKLWSPKDKCKYYDEKGFEITESVEIVYDTTAPKAFKECDCLDGTEVTFDEIVDGLVTPIVRKGIWVHFKKAIAMNAKVIGFSLLLLVIVMIGVIPMAKKLKETVADIADVGHTIIDGIHCWWDGDKGCYVSQGVPIHSDGRSYVRVTKKGGYEFYPNSVAQGMQDRMSGLLDNFRTIQQVPTIYDSLFCVIVKGIMAGNALAVTDSRLVLPNHVGAQILRYGAKLTNGRINIDLPPQGRTSGVFFLENIKDDCSVLCLESLKLNGIRNQFSKLIKVSPQQGLCRQVYRDANNEIHEFDGLFRCCNDDVTYTTASSGNYTVPKKSCRFTDAPGFGGICGALYINVNESNKDNLVGGVVMGFHIAADDTCQNRVFRVFDDIVFSLNSVFSTSLPPLSNPAGGLGEFYGVDSDKVNSVLPLHPHGRLGMTNCPGIPGCDEYSVSVLRPDDVGHDPLINGLDNLMKLSKRDVVLPPRLENVANVVAAKLCREAIIHKPSIEDTFSGGGYLPSLNRQAAVGPPLNKLGPTKRVLCMSAEELHKYGLDDIPYPNEDCVQMIQELIDKIRTGGVFDNACAVSLKEEARLTSKVDEFNTRLFAGSPGHEFLLQRMFFLGVAATFLKKNMLIHSALGLEPCDGRTLHNALLEGLKNPKVLVADYKKQDQSFSPAFFTLVERIIRSIAVGYVVGDEVVDENDYIRKVLIRRLAFSRLLIGREMVEPKGGHPSGSFLTTIFNIVCQIIHFTDGFSVMYNCLPEEVDSFVRMFFLGDDSVAAAHEADKYDPNIISKCAAESGFVITGNDKLTGLAWVEPYDYCEPRSTYTFLGRHFTRSVSVLELSRLSKMMQFCEVRRVLDVYPQSILSYRQEVSYYHATGQFDWLPKCFVQIKYLGFDSVDQFLSVSNEDLVAILLAELARDHKKMQVILPSYNRKYQAQGIEDDGQPLQSMDLGDAEFISNVDTAVVATDKLPMSYLSDHMDPVEYASSDIFERPYIIAQGLTGTTANVNLMLAIAPSSFFYKNFNAQAKLANFVYFRCRFCVKVIVASGPFVSGKLLLSCRPGFAGSVSVTQGSGDPCVEVDLSSAKSAILKFEQVTPVNWSSIEAFSPSGSISTSVPDFDFGSVDLWTLTSPSMSVAFTVYSWLEDVHVRGPGFTNFTFSSQGKDSASQVILSLAPGNGGDKKKKKVESHSNFLNTERGVKWKWRNETSPAWLTSVASSVETIGGMMEDIESSILGPLGDFSEKVGKSVSSGFSGELAAIMGASAPPVNTHFVCMLPVTNFAQAQMTTLVPVVKLAGVQTQKIVIPRTMFSRKNDEMNINTFASRMGVLGLISWLGSASAGSTLMSWNVMPGITPNYPISGGTEWTGVPIPLNFVCGTFKMWRGSIKYRLSIAKTAFHTGVLEIVWQMGILANTPSTGNQDALLCRYVWDVTESSSIEFEIPYVAKSAWSQIYFYPFNGNVFTAHDLYTGCLRVNVINPLMNSSGTVASNVSIVVYCGAGHDFELAVPGRHTQIALEPSKPHSGESESGSSSTTPVKRKFVAQGGPFGSDGVSDGVECSSCEQLRCVKDPSLWAHMTTIGERFLSFRNLVKRFSDFVAIGALGNGGVDGAVIMANNWFISYLQTAFVFWTGSLRVEFQLNDTEWSASPNPFVVTYAWNEDITTGLVWQNAGYPKLVIRPESSCNVVELPWYSPIPFRGIGDPGQIRLFWPYTTSFGEAFPSFPVSQVSFAAGDDFSLGFQIGPPPQTWFIAGPPILY